MPTIVAAATVSLIAAQVLAGKAAGPGIGPFIGLILASIIAALIGAAAVYGLFWVFDKSG